MWRGSLSVIDFSRILTLCLLLLTGCATSGMPAFPPPPVVSYEASRWPDAHALIIEEERDLTYQRADTDDGGISESRLVFRNHIKYPDTRPRIQHTQF